MCILNKLAVHPFQAHSWIKYFLGYRPQKGSGERHVQCGGDAFISDIGDRDPIALTILAGWQRDEVIKISAHLPGYTPGDTDLPPSHFWDRGGKETNLDVPSHGELTL